MDLLGLGIGVLFGAFLFLAGLANPDKIIGALRFKDFHVIRVIAVFVLVGMLGVWILDLFGVANFSVKPALLLPVLLGGALLGLGFGATGYCPGTGLACAATGRMDALVAVGGMLLGALAFILLYPVIVPPLEAALDFGKARIPEITGIGATVWVLGFVALGAAALWLTRGTRRTPKAARSPSEA